MEPEFLFLIPISLFILLVTAILISGDSYPNLVAALMTPQHSGATIAGLAISVLVVVLILSIPSSLFLFMKAHGATITPWLSSDWALTLALFASWMLYKLRQRAALLYGFLEVSAAVTAFFVLTHADGSDLTTKLLGFITGAYFVVRGLDNMRKGLDKDDPADAGALELWDRWVG